MRVRQALVDGSGSGAPQQHRVARHQCARLQHYAAGHARATSRPRCSATTWQRARQLLAEAGYPDGEGWPGLELTYNTSESHRKIAVALQQMWKDALNIDVTLANQEWKVYLDSIDQMNFQMARRGWIGDYVDPNNFLDLFLCGGGNNNTGFCDPRYDELVMRQAPRATSTR